MSYNSTVWEMVGFLIGTRARPKIRRLGYCADRLDHRSPHRTKRRDQSGGRLSQSIRKACAITPGETIATGGRNEKGRVFATRRVAADVRRSRNPPTGRIKRP